MATRPIVLMLYSGKTEDWQWASVLLIPGTDHPRTSTLSPGLHSMPNPSLFHDTFCAYALRLLFGPRLLPHPEERDPDAWRLAIDETMAALAASSEPGAADAFGEDLKTATLRMKPIGSALVQGSYDNPLDARRSRETLGHTSPTVDLRRMSGMGATSPISATEVVQVRLSSESRSSSIAERLPQEPRVYSPDAVERASAHSPQSSVSRFPQSEGEVEREKAQTQRYILVDWDGPNDPENPLNWSTGRKAWVLLQTCLWTFTMYLGSSIYTGGILSVSEEFHVSEVAATLGLTTFVIGYGIGPMFLSPISEIPQIGRMPIYIITLILFIILNIPTALATNFGMLLVFRFLTGFVGSPILATGGATIADMYIPRKRAYGITLWSMSATCAPAMGPLLGDFAGTFKGWRWTIWELEWLSCFILLVLFFSYPETSAANILHRRAARLRRSTGNTALRAQAELDAAHLSSRDLALDILVRPFSLNFQEPIVLALNVYISLLYAMLYMWFESFPIVFGEIYGWEPQLVGLAFLGIFVGCFAVIPPFYYWYYYYQEPLYDEGDLKPETRMPAAIVGAVIVPLCMFAFGWTSRKSVHWIVPIISSSWFSLAAILLFNTVLNYLADAYPKYAATVLAGNDLMRSLFGAAFPLFAGAMYHNLGVPWASTLLGLLATAFVPIPIALYKYGELIRLRSKRARHDY
ncbi:unnamed protein product [Peniophora sp. CBMAI 1063]|nr:unnamed protein product [Peniophora sp. CBMAI 1063]